MKNRLRLGLCCKFNEASIKFRTTTVAHGLRLKEKDLLFSFLSEIIIHNLDALSESIIYCAKNGIGSFRINSEFLPLKNHKSVGYDLSHLPDSKIIFDKFNKNQNLAKEHNIRLTFHPDQFVVINSASETVVENSLLELEYHGEMAELLGADVINIHAGGVYGDKAVALKQFKMNFNRLSEKVKKRLTLENDDKSYHVEDLLPVCQELKIALTYDVHHHRCLRDRLTVEEASKKAYETWDREPLFHISSPKDGWGGLKPERHHDFIDIDDFPEIWFTFPSLTVDIEAKGKEVAIKKVIADLRESYNL